MNRIIAITLLATATLMTAGSASAQRPLLRVNVPFNFTVNSTVLPAGNYTIAFDSIVPNTLDLLDRTKSVRARAYFLRGSIGPGREDRLIFHTYGGEHFLSEVGLDSASDGLFLPASKLESRARAGRKVELAFLAGH